MSKRFALKKNIYIFKHVEIYLKLNQFEIFKCHILSNLLSLNSDILRYISKLNLENHSNIEKYFRLFLNYKM